MADFEEIATLREAAAATDLHTQREVDDLTARADALEAATDLMLIAPVSNQPEAFDAYEVSLVGEFYSPGVGNYMETLESPDAAAQARDEVVGLLFTVYGHFPSGGVQALIDFDVNPDVPYELARDAALRTAYSIAGDADKVEDFTFDEESIDEAYDGEVLIAGVLYDKETGWEAS